MPAKKSVVNVSEDDIVNVEEKQKRPKSVKKETKEPKEPKETKKTSETKKSREIKKPVSKNVTEDIDSDNEYNAEYQILKEEWSKYRAELCELKEKETELISKIDTIVEKIMSLGKASKLKDINKFNIEDTITINNKVKTNKSTPSRVLDSDSDDKESESDNDIKIKKGVKKSNRQTVVIESSDQEDDD